MANEWIGSVISGVSGLLGALIGGGFVSKTAKRDSAQVERIARDERAHQKIMAREARDQDRLTDTYWRTLFTARRFGESTQAMTARPIGGSEHGADKLRRSALPELKEILEVEAMLDAYGSEAARRAFNAWHKVIFEVSKTRMEARERGELDHVDFGDLDRKLEDLQRKEQFARTALVHQVRTELRPGTASAKSD